MKLYLDVCCLCRLFDDQSQDKIRMEAEAITGILKKCVAPNGWVLVGSDIISLEVSKNKDSIKRQKILNLHDGAMIKTKYNETIKLRAKRLREYGIKLFDSLHLASSEYAEVDALLTTDKQFISSSARSDSLINVVNPLNFFMEVLNRE